MNKGIPTTRLVRYCGVARSTAYHRKKTDAAPRGRRPSTVTRTTTGNTVSNEAVLGHLRTMLAGECEHYGYIKCTHALRQAGFRINAKKVYRLMKTHRLLSVHRRPALNPPRAFVRTRTVTPSRPMETLEMDIKFVYIHGEHRMACLITILDVYSRRALEQRMAYSMKAVDVVALLQQLVLRWGKFGAIRLRTDNGAQFIANVVKDYCVQQAIEQEFIHPYTPQENGHIEAFHSLLQSEVIIHEQFTDRDHAEKRIHQWLMFYNQRRIHSGCKYRTPLAVWEAYWQEHPLDGDANATPQAA
jgi:putative transposase